MRLLILYEELATYFIKCITTFSIKYNCEIHIIRKEVNKDAPFELTLNKLKIYDKSEYSEKELLQLANSINPTAIFCGGWATKSYLKIAASFKNKIPCIIGFDNNWEGTMKQRMASVIAPLLITKKFDKCFVPGEGQRNFAQKIGFKKNKIESGAYCCDFDFFYQQYLENRKEKQNKFPHRFIFVGRYVELKGILNLWEAFIELETSFPNDWELWCFGAGDVKPVVHKKIKHFGFVQPGELTKYIHDIGVLVLPSYFEPWGVVVHEFAAAGFPIICSNKVGAQKTFVEDSLNGFVFTAGNKDELKNAMKSIIKKTNSELNSMAEISVDKAKQITPDKWADRFFELITN